MSSRALLAVASVAVGFAAADTYVVVLALPEMMAGAGLSVDELSRAAPIVSGFLLGYVAMLPLIGRIADLRGRVPVLAGSLVVFAIGSLVTAGAYDLSSMVAGRFLQGLGGGGLVPATLALVADLYPPARRGVPLGVVGAVQELGSVIGPLYGAAVLAVAGWREIFWINVAAGLALGVGVYATTRRQRRGEPSRRRVDWLSLALAVAAVACLALVLVQPDALAREVTWGLALVAVVGDSRWLSPLGLLLAASVAGLVVRGLTARAPLLDVRSWRVTAGAADLVGAALLATCLGGIVLAFATADPEVAVLSPAGPWLMALSGAALGAYVAHHRRVAAPLVPRGALGSRAAAGALGASLFVGAALIAALVDIPIFARVTEFPDSQLQAALVLVRLLVALPVGALLGGIALARLGPAPVTAVGMAGALAGFAVMSQWGLDSLGSAWATVPLVVTGLGFGLALAPVNAALLAATVPSVHGVVSALLVVARMVGMLVGVSVLTTAGLRRHYARLDELPTAAEVCGADRACGAYTTLVREAGLVQLQTVFVGAAACSAVAGVIALLTLPWSRDGVAADPRPPRA